MPNTSNDFIIESQFGFWDATNKQFNVSPEYADVYPTIEKANTELENIEKGFNASVRQLENDEQEMFLDEIPKHDFSIN